MSLSALVLTLSELAVCSCFCEYIVFVAIDLNSTFSCGYFLGGYLKMSLSSCDGGHKDNLSKPENVLTDNWSSEGIVRFYATISVYENLFSLFDIDLPHNNKFSSCLH